MHFPADIITCYSIMSLLDRLNIVTVVRTLGDDGLHLNVTIIMLTGRTAMF